MKFVVKKVSPFICFWQKRKKKEINKNVIAIKNLPCFVVLLKRSLSKIYFNTRNNTFFYIFGF